MLADYNLCIISTSIHKIILAFSVARTIFREPSVVIAIIFIAHNDTICSVLSILLFALFHDIVKIFLLLISNYRIYRNCFLFRTSKYLITHHHGENGISTPSWNSYGVSQCKFVDHSQKLLLNLFILLLIITFYRYQ